MTDISDDQIIDSIQNHSYKVTLYTPEDEETNVSLCISSAHDGNIKLYLKMSLNDIHGIFEQSYWEPFSASTDNIECMFCSESEPVRGIWTVSKHDLEFISHKECIEQLEKDIRVLCDKSSVDIVSRL